MATQGTWKHKAGVRVIIKNKVRWWRELKIYTRISITIQSEFMHTHFFDLFQSDPSTPLKCFQGQRRTGDYSCLGWRKKSHWWSALWTGPRQWFSPWADLSPSCIPGMMNCDDVQLNFDYVKSFLQTHLFNINKKWIKSLSESIYKIKVNYFIIYIQFSFEWT